MNLTEKETELFQALKKKKKVTLDELERILGGSRHAIIVRINYLGNKVAKEGWVIDKLTGVGRGAKAVYSMEKKF